MTKNQTMVTEISKILPLFTFFLLTTSSYSHFVPDNFLQCLSHKFPSNISVLAVVYLPSNSSYESVLESPIQNLRFITSSTQKPIAIITPLDYSHIQYTIVCCKQIGLQIRIRSGGHDYEGLSSTSNKVPFVILDLKNLRSVNVDIEDNTAWVESGATVGELYYWIAHKSSIHGFPAGICPTVGIGGHFTGGGFGTMLRKYGLAADNVIDARVIDANGKILDRESMGGDLFWAIRGGGGASFGVIVAWKIKLVYVPEVVTVFNLAETLDQGATDLVHKWQYIGHNLSENLFIRVIILATGNGMNRTLQVSFNSLFLGTATHLLKEMEEIFPELGLRREDCSEMSWIESALYFSGYPSGETIQDLKNRTPQPKSYFKATSDYVHEPLSNTALEQLWRWCLEEENPIIIFDPYGGRMNAISESETAFPHRKGNLYDIQYMVQWEDEVGEESEKHITWLRRVYEHMSPYVSKQPRSAYLNYRDLDLGSNNVTGSTYSEALVWGAKYFKNNFKRLTIIKGIVDPDNFFNYEQSIPPLILDHGHKAVE